MKKIVMAITAFLLIITLALGVVGCNKTIDTATSKSHKVVVYTSFYAMFDLAQKIGGDKVELHNLVPAGIEPHVWEPSPRDMANLEKADILVYNGAGMESWIDKVVNTLNADELSVIEASRGLRLLDNPDKDENLTYDPHVWLNPMLAKEEMKKIKDALAAKDPTNKAYYQRNYDDNVKKLNNLDLEYKNAVLKFKNKDVIVAHQAFGYLCNAYGLKQVAIEGLSADSEPTPGKMAEITTFAKVNKVKYIYFEELISPKTAEIIAKEAGAKTAVLNPLEGLSEQAVKSGKEYFSVMRDNLKVLKNGLE